MGMSGVKREGEGDINIIKEDELEQIEDIVSLPFSIDFFIPVVKITCGDSFSGLLTAEGRVHTWGCN
jgi:alpha-tubulin suppressor-like RCC1 family protein